MIFSRGATTGGTDLIARLLKLPFAWLPMGKLVMAVDLTMLLAVSVAFRSLESADDKKGLRVHRVDQGFQGDDLPLLEGAHEHQLFIKECLFMTDWTKLTKNLEERGFIPKCFATKKEAADCTPQGGVVVRGDFVSSHHKVDPLVAEEGGGHPVPGAVNVDKLAGLGQTVDRADVHIPKSIETMEVILIDEDLGY